MNKQYALLAAVLTLPLMQAGCRQDSGSDDGGTKIAVESDIDGSGATDGLTDDDPEEASQTVEEIHDSIFAFDYGSDSKRVSTEMRNGNSDIYIRNSDGTDLTWLAYSPANEIFPMISSDGSKIAFLSNREGIYEIYVMNADGSEQTRLTNSPDGAGIPRISPDGSKVLFSSLRDGNEDIYIIGSDGTGQMQLTNSSGRNNAASFNHDGSKIVFVSTRDGTDEIFVMNSDGSGQTNLTDNAGQEEFPWFPHDDGSMVVSAPLFTLDSSKIVFETWDGEGKAKRYIMNLDGSGLTLQTDAMNMYWEKVFSDLIQASS